MRICWVAVLSRGEDIWVAVLDGRGKGGVEWTRDSAQEGERARASPVFKFAPWHLARGPRGELSYV